MQEGQRLSFRLYCLIQTVFTYRSDLTYRTDTLTRRIPPRPERREYRCMLWFFDRDDQKVEVETRFDNNTLDYVLIIRWPDGREETERYADSESFSTRVFALAEQ